MGMGTVVKNVTTMATYIKYINILNNGNISVSGMMEK